YPSVQNLMLAARALGLGTVLTTLHRRRKAQIHAILGIPDHIESAAIIPLGWPDREYGPNRRPPLARLVIHDRWDGWSSLTGHASKSPGHGRSLPMARLSLKLAGCPWDHLPPLLTGEVVPEGIDLQYDVRHGLGPVTDDPSCAGGEASLGRFMIDMARGHRHFVGLPVFPMVAFRHRCFLVKRGTTLSDLAALEGKRVGID